MNRLDGALAPLGSFSMTMRLSGLFVEDLGAGRKNLVAAALAPSDPSSSSGRTLLVSLDPVTGAEVWRSPDLFGTVTRSSASWLQLGGAWRLASVPAGRCA